MAELIIIGGGPAGVSAALYALRAGIKVLLLENGPGALAKAHRIENYYGAAAAGTELYAAGLEQAAALGAEIHHEEVLSLDYTGNFAVQTASASYEAPAVILSTGTKTLPSSLMDCSGWKDAASATALYATASSIAAKMSLS